MAKGGRWSDGELVEVRDMRDAETTLAIIRDTAIHAGRPTRTRESQDVQFMDNRPLESRVL